MTSLRMMAAVAAAAAGLVACGGGGSWTSGTPNPTPTPTPDPNPFDARPTFLVGEPQRFEYDGTTNGLLTGLAPSLADLIAYPETADPDASELRTLAIKTSYTSLLDVSPNGGFGTYFGRLSAEANRGTEYVAVADDGTGLKNVTIVVSVPSTFHPARACIVAAPSSGSRGVYGEIGTIGEWAFNHGCALAMTDKGTGVGVHDLDRDLSYEVRGTQVAAGSRTDLTFNANLLGEDLTAFRAAYPNRMAIKHAHGKQNPERDWGSHTLQAVRTAFYVLNVQFPEADFKPANTLVIASSISNGGAAVLRAAEQDADGLIDGVVAAEPQINMPTAMVRVRREGVTVPNAGRPLFDYITMAGLYQACAVLAPALDPTRDFVDGTRGANRCRSLAEMGLVNGGTDVERGFDALVRLRTYGWEAEADLLHDSHFGLEFTDLVATTYASAYARASVIERLCGYSASAYDGLQRGGIPPDPFAMATAWGHGGGLFFMNDGFAIINDTAVGGPTYNPQSVSASTNRADYNVDGAACLRRLATAGNVGNTTITAAEQAIAARIQTGIAEVRVTGNLRGKPAIVVHGRADALVPVNHTSRPYAALNRAVESASQLRYYEVTDANHFDALVGIYPRTFVPLHVYTLRALDLMHAHLTSGSALPPSQVVRAVARANAAVTLTDDNVPPIAASPAADDTIALEPGSIDVPN